MSLVKQPISKQNEIYERNNLQLNYNFNCYSNEVKHLPSQSI